MHDRVFAEFPVRLKFLADHQNVLNCIFNAKSRSCDRKFEFKLANNDFVKAEHTGPEFVSSIGSFSLDGELDCSLPHRDNEQRTSSTSQISSEDESVLTTKKGTLMVDGQMVKTVIPQGRRSIQFDDLVTVTILGIGGFGRVELVSFWDAVSLCRQHNLKPVLTSSLSWCLCAIDIMAFALYFFIQTRYW